MKSSWGRKKRPLKPWRLIICKGRPKGAGADIRKNGCEETVGAVSPNRGRRLYKERSVHRQPVSD